MFARARCGGRAAQYFVLIRAKANTGSPMSGTLPEKAAKLFLVTCTTVSRLRRFFRFLRFHTRPRNQTSNQTFYISPSYTVERAEKRNLYAVKKPLMFIAAVATIINFIQTVFMVFCICCIISHPTMSGLPFWRFRWKAETLSRNIASTRRWKANFCSLSLNSISLIALRKISFARKFFRPPAMHAMRSRRIIAKWDYCVTGRRRSLIFHVLPAARLLSNRIWLGKSSSGDGKRRLESFPIGYSERSWKLLVVDNSVGSCDDDSEDEFIIADSS